MVWFDVLGAPLDGPQPEVFKKADGHQHLHAEARASWWPLGLSELAAPIAQEPAEENTPREVTGGGKPQIFQAPRDDSGWKDYFEMLELPLGQECGVVMVSEETREDNSYSMFNQEKNKMK